MNGSSPTLATDGPVATLPRCGLPRLDLPGAALWFAPQWLAADAADALFAAARDTIAWETHRIRLFGRLVDSPRRSCWIGDPGTDHTYSHTRFAPRPWPAPLLPLRARIAAAAGAPFNSVLANLYRDGRDTMGWHADDEAELGAQPVIASLSLGAPRRFVLKHRHDATRKLTLLLPHGSLLVMAGDTQRNYRHALPRSTRVTLPRINLTFRRIFMD